MTLYHHAQSLYARFPSSLRPVIFLGGGCLRAYYDNTLIKDIDCFFNNEEDYAAVKEELERSRNHVLRKAGERYCEYTYLPDGTVINLVGFTFGSPREHLERFDFRCCQLIAWWGTHGNGVCAVYHPDAPDDARDKLLYIVNNNGTERTLRRIAHYVEDYGYTLHPAQTVEQADAFEDAFDPFDAHRLDGVKVPGRLVEPPEWMMAARRRVAALPVQPCRYPEV